jgi:hypothetical protein
MTLYHFTAAEKLPAISSYGLTVGDVPTSRFEGKIGIWLTASGHPEHTGLEGGALDKKRYRLSVDLPDSDARLVKWTDWYCP